MADCLPTLIATVGPEASVALESYLADAGDAVPAPLVELLAAARQQPATEYVAAQRVRGNCHGLHKRLLKAHQSCLIGTNRDRGNHALSDQEMIGGAVLDTRVDVVFELAYALRHRDVPQDAASFARAKREFLRRRQIGKAVDFCIHCRIERVL